MGTRADNFFTPDERERIRQAVVAAEGTTSGEIAVMLVDASDSYREAESLGAVLFAGLAGLIVAIAAGLHTIWLYIPLVFALFFPARWVFRHRPGLKPPLVGSARLNAAVMERAVRSFYEKGLYKTVHETGVLIFISLLERKVWILGDRGINQKIAPHLWQQFAAELSQGIRQGNPCEAVCTTISRCGTELRRHFPRQADDINELPDELITGR